MTPELLHRFLDRAFAISSPLAAAQFGPFAATIRADDVARPQGFEKALVAASVAPEFEMAVVAGRDPVLDEIFPALESRTLIVRDAGLYLQTIHGPDAILSLYDRRSRRGVTWFPAGDAPPYAIGQPFVPVIHAHIVETGWCPVHAAAVGRDGKFVLMPGPGKAGKSTAALACVRAGWDYAGDDFVLINPTEGLVAPLFSSARMRQSGAAAFAELISDTTFAVTDDEGADRYELRLPLKPRGGAIAATLLVRRTGTEPFVFRPARGADTIAAILRHSVARAPGYHVEMTRKLLLAAKMAPSFIVDTGNDPAAIPDAFATFLQEPAWQNQRTA